MVAVTELWLPILVSAAFVFIASSIIHMVLPIHKGDFRKMPGEDKILAEMRGQGVGPGSYMFPCAGSMKDMSSPEMVEKCRIGPVGFLVVVPSPGMGKSLVQWFLYSILIGAFVAYIGGLALDRGAAYRAVFHLTGAAAVLAYGARPIPDSIWKGQQWSITFKFVIDGVVYGLITGAVFAWLWPAAA
jgi:hypothetical protein